MKKIITLVCTIACVFGLTACEGEVTYTEYEQQKLDMAEQIASQAVVPYFAMYMEEGSMQSFEGLTPEEIGHVFYTSMQLEADGNAVLGAATSYNNAAETVGTITEIGEPTSKIDDKSIIVTVPVTGSLKNGNAEVILSNDMFFRLESTALNEESTLKDAMVKAALNTIIGMGTVFIVLVLISFIIALFGYIPKIQAKMADRKNNRELKGDSVNNTIAQIAEKEAVDVTDDYELVAVIAAAIAASEGAASTDGFVVRSVRKVNRRR